MLRAWVEGVMTRTKNGVVPSLYRGAMTVPSYCYQAAIKGRHALYDHGLLPIHTLSVPIISVGNLICGGAGKTQVVLLLAEKLKMKGWKIGIVSRGYQRSLKGVIRVDPHTMHADECGDEPLMLARRLPEAIVVVGKDRVKGAELATAFGAQIIILDDGMQHRRIGRDLEMVVVDGEDPLASGEFLPKGQLRELPERLQSADLVISVGPLDEQFDECPHIEVRIVPVALYNSKGESIRPPQKVGLFCGIGSPNRFVQTIQEMGCEVVTTHFLSDHETISQEILDDFAEKARVLGATMLLCTEKDWVKGGFNSLLPIAWLRTQMEVVAGEERLESILMKEWV